MAARNFPPRSAPGPLAGRVVWTTGSARRVGRAIALACARAGADVVVHYRESEADAIATAAEAEELGVRALVVRGDHCDPAAPPRIAAEIEARFGRLDALVNNASTFERTPLDTLDGDRFARILDENLVGPYRCVAAALPLLRRAPAGHIVNIGDWAAERAYRGYAAYIAAKGGLEALTRSLARELAPGIRVNAVAPGAVLEPPDLTDAARARILERTPLARWGAPDDVASAVVFLLTSDFITGATIPVDGGRRIG
ncbi:MAG: SDR family oxidoreductase [Candidatus Sumerlaeia bacterium]|nr:SDR family oxidoreductase [Candidatus Sumerlaeia bacterium]